MSNTPQTTAASAAVAVPAQEQDFVLEPPAPALPVPIESASGKVRLKVEEVQQLDAQVAQFIDDITANDSQSPAFKGAVERIHGMGNKEIGRASCRERV